MNNDILLKALENNKSDECIKLIISMMADSDNAEKKKSFNKSFVEFQSIVSPIYKDAFANLQKFTYKYSTLDNIINIVKPPLTSCGLSFTFEQKQYFYNSEYVIDSNQSLMKTINDRKNNMYNKDNNGTNKESQKIILANNCLKVTCILLHIDGYSIKSILQHNISGDLQNVANVQDTAKILTYLRRYTLMSVLGITCGDDKDDNDTGDNYRMPTANCYTLIDEKDQLELTNALNQKGMDSVLFCEKARIKSLNLLPKAKLEGAINFIKNS